MIDLNQLRNQAQAFKEACRKKNIKFDVDAFRLEDGLQFFRGDPHALSRRQRVGVGLFLNGNRNIFVAVVARKAGALFERVLDRGQVV